MTEYEKQATEVLQKLGATLTTECLRVGRHFPDDNEDRLIYRFTITRGSRSYSGESGGSLKDTEQARLKKIIPVLSDYDVIAGLTRHDPGNFENFCADYGYDTDSRKAEQIYHAVKAEYQGLAMLFNEDELCLLREVC